MIFTAQRYDPKQGKHMITSTTGISATDNDNTVTITTPTMLVNDLQINKMKKVNRLNML